MNHYTNQKIKFMKKIVFLFLTAVMLSGCAEVDKSYNDKMPAMWRVLVIDSCEYVYEGYRLAHKGNCKYCEERRKKEQEELLSKIKGE